MKNKNAQSAIEFLIVFSAFLIFFILFFSVLKINMLEKNKDKEILIAQNIALGVQYELNLASESSEGYYRTFQVPPNILGRDYQINVSENRVYIFVRDFGISYQILGVNGLIEKGLNTITKQNGTVYLNSFVILSPPAECDDTIDNDGDGWIDLTDPGCDDDLDDDESFTGPTECSNEIDDDSDTFIDGNDPDCDNSADNNESGVVLQCNDLIDNDNDGWIDLTDPGCDNSTDTNESFTGPTECSNEIDDDLDTFIDGNDVNCDNSTDDNEGSGGVVGVDSGSGSSGDSDVISWSHTTGTGSNRLLVVGIASDPKNGETLDNISYGSTLLTFLRSDQGLTGKARSELWYLVNPASGTYTITVQFSQATANAVAGAVSFTGVNQALPLSNGDWADAKNYIPSVTISSSPGDMVVDIMGHQRKYSGDLTVGSGQSERWQEMINGEFSGGQSTELGASSVVMNWTSPESNDWIISAVNVNAI